MRILVPLVIGVLGGCMSIPPKTAAQLSTLDARTLQGLDPTELRVRIASDNGVDFDPKDLLLSLAVTDAAGRERVNQFHMVSLHKGRETRPGGWLHSDYVVNSSELMLDPQSVADMNELLKSLPSSTHKGFRFSVSWKNVTIPDGVDSFRAWIDLQLKAADGYFVLADGAEVEVERGGN